MNQFVIVFGFVIFSTFICAPSDAANPRSDNLLNFVEKCKVETKASDNDVNIFLKRKVPTTTEGACFYACIKRSTGLTSADGKLNMTALQISMAPIKESDKNYYDKLYKIFEDCKAQEIVEDVCVMSKKFSECVITEKQKLTKTR